mgnify:CR=1 FL=1
MLDETQLQEKIEKTPAPRVTKEYMESRIEDIKFVRMHDVSRKNDTGTICTLYLDNGFTVRGESACVNVENYDKEIGEKITCKLCKNCI